MGSELSVVILLSAWGVGGGVGGSELSAVVLLSTWGVGMTSLFAIQLQRDTNLEIFRK